MQTIHHQVNRLIEFKVSCFRNYLIKGLWEHMGSNPGKEVADGVDLIESIILVLFEDGF